MIPWWLQRTFFRRLIDVFLIRPRFIYGTVIIPVLVMTVIVCFGWTDDVFSTEATEDRVRISGSVLQLLGLIVVAAGIRRIRKSLGRPDAWERVQRWRAEIRKVFSAPKAVEITLGPGSASASGGMVGVGRGSDNIRSVDERIAELENKVEALAKADHELSTLIRKEVVAREREDKEERNQRIRADSALRKLIEEIEAGGIDIEIMGLSWLLLGVVLGTLGPELDVPLSCACTLMGLGG